MKSTVALMYCEYKLCSNPYSFIKKEYAKNLVKGETDKYEQFKRKICNLQRA